MESFQKPEGSYISYFSNMVKQQGGINLAQGIPGFSPPAELLKLLSDSLQDNIHQYAPGSGNFHLINQIAHHYNLPSENLLIVQGATEALSLIYTYIHTILNDNFTVLSFEPAYESYLNLPKIFGQEFIHFQLDSNYSYCPDTLSKTIREKNVRLVFISSPGNPYGKIWGKDELYHLIELSKELNFYFVLDIVYEQLYFKEPPCLPIEMLNPHLFFVNSFSKMLCITGWRIGYLIADEIHMEKIRSIHDYIGLCAPSLLQNALARYLEKNDFGSAFTQNFRNNLKRSFDLLVKTLMKVGFSVPPIQGGCFVWAKLPDNWNDGFAFASHLYNKEKVAVIPGEHFSVNHMKWIRFNIARPEEEILSACEKIELFMNKGDSQYK